MISEECLTIEWIKTASAQNNKADPKNQFAYIVKKKGFTRFELQERGKRSHIDKAHYKFYYKPAHKTAQEEEYILLDIVFQNNFYNKLIKKI